MTTSASLSFPPNFVTLSTACDRKDAASNVIGIVVDYLPIAKSRGPDYTARFTLHDDTWYEGLGLLVQYFRPSKDLLPPINDCGDVVILRNLKCKFYKDEVLTGLSNSSTTWVVLDNESIRNSSDPNGADITFKKSLTAPSPMAMELRYAKAIHMATDPAIYQQPQRPTVLQVEGTIQHAGGPSAPRVEKFNLVKDLIAPTSDNERSFTDIIGEVRRLFKNDFRVELFISDYTSHRDLYNYSYGDDGFGSEGDPYGYTSTGKSTWPGPWGQMTVQVTLWDANASFAAREISEGDYVFLKNVSLRTGKQGARLEGHCRGDRHNPSRVNVVRTGPNDASNKGRVIDFLKRKKEYEQLAKEQNRPFVKQIGYRKRIREQTGDDHENSQVIKHEASCKPPSRNKRRRENNKKQRGVQMTHEKTVAKPLARNNAVRCEGINIPLTTITEILSPGFRMRKTPKGNDFYIPFQNCCYKSRVRVVDFLPHNLADFAQARRMSEYEVRKDSDDDSDSDLDLDSQPEPTASGDCEIKWEWSFALIVVDAGPSARNGNVKVEMPLIVSDRDADYLLRKIDPCDLRKNPKRLEELRSQLWALWGDLEERKGEAKVTEDYGAAASSVPFECFIKEYGVCARDGSGQKKNDMNYERMFRLFGTSIT